MNSIPGYNPDFPGYNHLLASLQQTSSPLPKPLSLSMPNPLPTRTTPPRVLSASLESTPSPSPKKKEFKILNELERIGINAEIAELEKHLRSNPQDERTIAKLNDARLKEIRSCYQVVKNAHQKTKGEKEAAESKVTQIREENTRLQTCYQTQSLVLKAKDKDLESRKRKIDELTGQVDEKEVKRKKVEAENGQLRKELEQLKQQLKENSQQKTKLEEEQAAHKLTKSMLIKQRDNNAELKKNLDSFKEHKASMAQLQKDVEAGECTIVANQSRIKQLVDQVGQLAKEKLGLEEQIKSQVALMGEKDKQIKEKDSQISHYQQLLSTARLEWEKNRPIIAQLEQTVKTLEGEKAKLTSDGIQLQILVNKHETFMKTMNKAQDHLVEVAKPVVTLLKMNQQTKMT